jgi:hypothetical protein
MSASNALANPDAALIEPAITGERVIPELEEPEVEIPLKSCGDAPAATDQYLGSGAIKRNLASTENKIPDREIGEPIG